MASLIKLDDQLFWASVVHLDVDLNEKEVQVLDI